MVCVSHALFGRPEALQVDHSVIPRTTLTIPEVAIGIRACDETGGSASTFSAPSITYPTGSEANKNAAGEWRRAHISRRLLICVEKYHPWRRGWREIGAGATRKKTSRCLRNIGRHSSLVRGIENHKVVVVFQGAI
jgi:hypothetical protein